MSTAFFQDNTSNNSIYHLIEISVNPMFWLWKRLQRVKWRNTPANANQAYVPTAVEHIANIVTHGVWVVPSVWATYELFLLSHTWAHVIAAVVYGVSLFLLFTTSTFFHAVHYCNQNKALKDILHRSDRAMIYVFIAASYFPWLMVGPIAREGAAAQLCWVVWLLAFLGILYQQFYHERYKTLETFFYCVMGLGPASAVVALDDFHGLAELKLGGVIYLTGIGFFKSDGRVPCAHAMWHSMVALAAATHFIAIRKYLYLTQTPD